MTKLSVLIVEDKQEKIKLLSSVIKKNEIEAESVPNVDEAQKKLISKKYDIVLIDIQVPNDMVSDINFRGGVDLLEWIELYPLCKKPKRIFGITSHTETKKQFDQDFINKGFYLIKSQVDDDSWLKTIVSTCNYLLSDEVQNEEINFDIAIITAMSHNELAAVLSLPIHWEEFRLPHDPSIYHKSVIGTSNGEKTIVASHSPRMGLSSAAALSTKLIMKFSPKYIIMAGIAAGIEGKVNFGDVLVADPCWDWGNGKLTQKSGKSLFQPAPHQEALSLDLRGKIQSVRDKRLYLDQMYNEWRGKKPTKQLQLKLGPLASGAVVLEDPETTKNITFQHRETIGIEMEAYGVMMAANITTSNTKPIIIKSVCDFANPQKNDDWQKYAAYTSAQFIFHFISNDLYT